MNQVMQSINEFEEVNGNFNEENLRVVRTAVSQEKQSGVVSRQVFTLVQDNAPCKVEVTKASRKKCVSSLLK